LVNFCRGTWLYLPDQCQYGVRLTLTLGRGYSYEIIRAKTLYSKEARKVGSGIRAGRGKVEYGPHIPTLLKQAEGGELD
ncbi:hypothetical protein ACE1B5_01970, partial [Klebsiella pneumoniae]